MEITFTRVLNNKEWKLMCNELSNIRYYCKCGHSVLIGNHEKKVLCDFCGYYVFKNKRDEFLYRMKSKL